MSDYELGRDIWLWIDPAQFCNISCELCYTRPSHKRRFLEPAALETYLARFEGGRVRVREVTVNWRGEPLTNKFFPQLLDQICQAFPGVRVQFHTNAMLLSARVAARLCAIDHPFHVYLSIDGGTRHSHEANRGTGTFDRAIGGGLNLLRARGGAAWPQITLYQLDLRVAEERYDPAFLDLALRCDAWQRVVPVTRAGSEAHSSCAVASEDGLDPTDLWSTETSGPPPRGACFWAGYSLSVAPDGDVSVCILSQVNSPGGRLGNLGVDSIETVLQEAEGFRVRLEGAGRSGVLHCASCHKIEGRPRPPTAARDLRSLAARSPVLPDWRA